MHNVFVSFCLSTALTKPAQTARPQWRRTLTARPQWRGGPSLQFDRRARAVCRHAETARGLFAQLQRLLGGVLSLKARE